MIKEALYNKTVGILVDAYFNDTLRHGSCSACAVGNIVAANLEIKVFPKGGWSRSLPYWSDVHIIDSLTHEQIFFEDGHLYRKEGIEQIKTTGYTPEQTAQIEYAFETASQGNSKEDWMFNGLMAVIEVLDKIHENTDEAITTQTKQRFNKAGVLLK